MRDVTAVKRGLGDDVRAWLERALAARPGMSRTAVIETSGVSRPTFYRLLAGGGNDVEQGTLDRLAQALGVPAPQIVSGLDAEAPAPTTPVGLVQEAQRLLRRAEELLETPSAPPVSDVEAVRAVRAAKAADQSPRRRRNSR